MKALLVCTAILTTTYQFQICPSVRIGNYEYDLSVINNSTTIAAIVGASIVQISPCALITCPSAAETTFALRKSDTYCQPFTSSSAPLKQYYKMIDENNPKKGIAFSFVPFFDSNATQTTQMPDEDNSSQVVLTSMTEHLFQTKVQIYCDLQATQSTVCSHSKTTSEQQDEMGNILFTESEQISCAVYLSAGCPQLVQNHFWTFLGQTSIILAILIWVSAVFMLLFGYVAIRVTILMMGMYTGSFVGTIFSAQDYQDFFMESSGIFIYIIVLATLMGALYGIFLLTIPKLGYLNIGLWAALVLSLLLQNSVLYLTGSNLAFYITFGVLGLLMAIISQMQFSWFIVFCTSFVGAFWIVRTLGFFLPHFPNQFDSSANLQIGYHTPWQFYLYLTSIVILTVLGIAFQLCLLKKLGYQKGRNNGGYYLEMDGPIKEKLKKIFEFQQIKEMFKAGKKQIVQLKQMIGDHKQLNRSRMSDDSYVQMRDLQQSDEQQDIKKTSKKSKKKSMSEESDEPPVQKYVDSTKKSKRKV